MPKNCKENNSITEKDRNLGSVLKKVLEGKLGLTKNS